MSCGRWRRIEMGGTGLWHYGLVRRCINVAGYPLWTLSVKPLPKPQDSNRFAASVYDDAQGLTKDSGFFPTETAARKFADDRLRYWRRRMGG